MTFAVFNDIITSVVYIKFQKWRIWMDMEALVMFLVLGFLLYVIADTIGFFIRVIVRLVIAFFVIIFLMMALGIF